MSGWNTVHVRINDASTGQPVPVRAAFYAQGRQLAPLGSVLDFPAQSGVDVGGHVEIGPERFHYIDGACEIALPPGEIAVDLSRGFEYQPVRHIAQLAPGQIALRFTIERAVNLQTLGWYPGDTRVEEVSPHTAILEATCEDVAVVNLLARQRQGGLPPSNLLAFSGQEPALSREGHLVAVNTLNVNDLLGTLGLLCCHRPVFPLRAGDEGLDSWTTADWCDQCHRKKTGLVVWSDPQIPEAGIRLKTEGLADLATGRIDAYEVLGFDDAEPVVLADWYRLLDAGFRLPLAGGSGKDGGGRAIGSVRTYAYLGPLLPFDYRAWIEAVRHGKTFITSGPLVQLLVSGLGPGSVLEVEPGQRVPIWIEAKSTIPFEKLELLINGSLIAGKEASGTRMSAVVETEWAANESCWIAARVTSTERLHNGQVIFAHTSPIYVDVKGRLFRPDVAVVQYLVAQVDDMIDWTWNRAPKAATARPERLADVLTAARQALEHRAAR